MSTKILLIACCIPLIATAALAQGSGSAADPISGTWTGFMRPTDAPPSQGDGNPITVELKFDGATLASGTVTGPNLTPGEIRSGRFDAASGALTFGVAVPGESETFMFEGTMVRGTATGRVRAGSRTGVFIIAKTGGAAAPAQAPRGGVSEEFREAFAQVSGWVSRAAELVPAERYAYRPTESVRTFGQQIAHIADSYNYYCAHASGRDVEWSDAIEKGSTDKSTLIQKLEQARAACTTAYGASGQVGPLLGNIGHTSLHYGNIITYMRMMGLVPPSS